MKYFTREWYTETHMQPDIEDVKSDRRAAKFSEEFFQNLYAQKLREWSAETQEFAMVAFNEEYPKEFQASPVMYSSMEAYMQAKQQYLWEREETLDAYMRDVRNEVASKAEFNAWFQDELELAQRLYPKELLDAVADVRVLALGVAAPEIKKQIDGLVRERKGRLQAPHRSYAQHHAALLRKYPDSFIEEFGFCDSVVKRVEQRGQELILDLEEDFGAEERIRLHFLDCEILRMDAGLAGAEWLYEEIYEGESGGWEIHVLFFNGEADEDDPLGELILRTSDVCIDWEFDGEDA